MAKATVTH